ncbi:MAG: 6-carboxytetrahydropterin synthase QueD [Spirochaetes bacterium]|nr:6-carboxytetrahydropterin synthase QueD [Spirochaetota bacterium]
MFTVRVEDTFAAAHFLSRYHGKCERLHGHNYKVWVTVKGNELDQGGMLFDFGILKKKLHEILDIYDHGNLNECDDFKDGNPSAERIAYSIYRRLSPFLSGINKKRDSNISIARVEVFETEKNLAAYIPE